MPSRAMTDEGAGKIIGDSPQIHARSIPSMTQASGQRSPARSRTNPLSAQPVDSGRSTTTRNAQTPLPKPYIMRAIPIRRSVTRCNRLKIQQGRCRQARLRIKAAQITIGCRTDPPPTSARQGPHARPWASSPQWSPPTTAEIPILSEANRYGHDAGRRSAQNPATHDALYVRSRSSCIASGAAQPFDHAHHHRKERQIGSRSSPWEQLLNAH